MVIQRAFDEHRAVMERATATLPAVVEEIRALTAASLRRGAKVLVCGNGGSAADAQHFAAELVGRFQRERAALAAIALTTDTSALTSIANDYGYEKVFARQVAALARPGDVLLAISTSGNSPNVLLAAKEARARGCSVVALTGASGGKLAEVADVLLASPSTVVARIQEVHELCLHALAEALEADLADAAAPTTGAP